jgi:hypothetical protein
MNKLDTITVFGALTKAEQQDDGTLKIEGVASAEVVDSAGETILASAMKAAIPGFMNAGKGSLRVMHQLVAAGVVDDVEVDEHSGLTKISGTVVDTDTVRKVRLKVLRGLSIGGKVTSRDPKNSKIITGVDWRELSLVDRPSCSAAVLLAKAVPAVSLGQQPVSGGTDDMAAVRSLGSLSQAEVEAYLERLSNEDRATLLINVIMRKQFGRRM